MRNAGLNEAQAGIKVAGRNISNLRYADETTLMAESEELKSLLMNDFPGGPAVKNPPSSAWDTGSIPGWGTKIPHATGPLRPHRNY